MPEKFVVGPAELSPCGAVGGWLAGCVCPANSK